MPQHHQWSTDLTNNIGETAKVVSELPVVKQGLQLVNGYIRLNNEAKEKIAKYNEQNGLDYLNTSQNIIDSAEEGLKKGRDAVLDLPGNLLAGAVNAVSKATTGQTIEPSLLKAPAQIAVGFTAGRASLSLTSNSLANRKEFRSSGYSAPRVTRRQAIEEALPMLPAEGRNIGAAAKPKKVRAKFSKEQRDDYVDNNLYPTRQQLTNNADFRGVTGDVQAGVKGLAIRMENRPEYLAAQRGQTPETLNRQTPTFMVPHHRMGIQDQTAFMTGLTAKEAAEWRNTLKTGGFYPGNTKENLESVYDGVLSKGGRKEGMFSTDHDEIHKLADKLRQDYGIEINSKNRSLDKIHGQYIKDLPKKDRLELMIQLAIQDEEIINGVIARRMKLFRKEFGHLPYEEQKEIILKSPKRFANLSISGNT